MNELFLLIFCGNIFYFLFPRILCVTQRMISREFPFLRPTPNPSSSRNRTHAIDGFPHCSFSFFPSSDPPTQSSSSSYDSPQKEREKLFLLSFFAFPSFPRLETTAAAKITYCKKSLFKGKYGTCTIYTCTITTM